MDPKVLHKQVFNFERKTLQLDQCNDAMSDLDWEKLAEKLEASEPTLGDVGRKFQKKLTGK